MIHTRTTGFTLVELISVMIIVGILAVFALPRFFDRQTYDARRFYEETVSILRYAQKAAIAQRRLVCVSFPTNHSVELNIASTNPETVAGACDKPLSGPQGTPPYTVTADGSVTFTGTPNAFNFDALGRPTSSPGTIQITGAANSITVEAETGYVH
ncbi:GspH/FimT family pseudopilin [Noviherbaspirillum sp.]|jgi:MSHA pilin protein MshC|uniref:GspH/FimT family pseudopilin n=1 Tax=Noviherbaspirillum sp. TaxID=1926288 RepID=UPI0025DF8399|nr:GspH/FimT family pseudopilin [Noviherbaspirillum sp.]